MQAHSYNSASEEEDNDSIAAEFRLNLQIRKALIRPNSVFRSHSNLWFSSPLCCALAFRIFEDLLDLECCFSAAAARGRQNENANNDENDVAPNTVHNNVLTSMQWRQVISYITQSIVMRSNSKREKEKEEGNCEKGENQEEGEVGHNSSILPEGAALVPSGAAFPPPGSPAHFTRKQSQVRLEVQHQVQQHQQPLADPSIEDQHPIQHPGDPPQPQCLLKATSFHLSPVNRMNRWRDELKQKEQKREGHQNHEEVEAARRLQQNGFAENTTIRSTSQKNNSTKSKDKNDPVVAAIQKEKRDFYFLGFSYAMWSLQLACCIAERTGFNFDDEEEGEDVRNEEEEKGKNTQEGQDIDTADPVVKPEEGVTMAATTSAAGMLMASRKNVEQISSVTMRDTNNVSKNNIGERVSASSAVATAHLRHRSNGEEGMVSIEELLLTPQEIDEHDNGKEPEGGAKNTTSVLPLCMTYADWFKAFAVAVERDDVASSRGVCHQSTSSSESSTEASLISRLVLLRHNIREVIALIQCWQQPSSNHRPHTMISHSQEERSSHFGMTANTMPKVEDVEPHSIEWISVPVIEELWRIAEIQTKRRQLWFNHQLQTGKGGMVGRDGTANAFIATSTTGGAGTNNNSGKTAQHGLPCNSSTQNLLSTIFASSQFIVNEEEFIKTLSSAEHQQQQQPFSSPEQVPQRTAGDTGSISPREVTKPHPNEDEEPKESKTKEEEEENKVEEKKVKNDDTPLQEGEKNKNEVEDNLLDEINGAQQKEIENKRDYDDDNAEKLSLEKEQAEMERESENQQGEKGKGDEEPQHDVEQEIRLNEKGKSNPEQQGERKACHISQNVMPTKTSSHPWQYWWLESEEILVLVSLAEKLQLSLPTTFTQEQKEQAESTTQANDKAAENDREEEAQEEKITSMAPMSTTTSQQPLDALLSTVAPFGADIFGVQQWKAATMTTAEDGEDREQTEANAALQTTTETRAMVHRSPNLSQQSPPSTALAKNTQKQTRLRNRLQRHYFCMKGLQEKAEGGGNVNSNKKFVDKLEKQQDILPQPDSILKEESEEEQGKLKTVVSKNVGAGDDDLKLLTCRHIYHALIVSDTTARSWGSDSQLLHTFNNAYMKQFKSGIPSSGSQQEPSANANGNTLSTTVAKINRKINRKRKMEEGEETHTGGAERALVPLPNEANLQLHEGKKAARQHLNKEQQNLLELVSSGDLAPWQENYIIRKFSESQTKQRRVILRHPTREDVLPSSRPQTQQSMFNSSGTSVSVMGGGGGFRSNLPPPFSREGKQHPPLPLRPSSQLQNNHNATTTTTMLLPLSTSTQEQKSPLGSPVPFFSAMVTNDELDDCAFTLLSAIEERERLESRQKRCMAEREGQQRETRKIVLPFVSNHNNSTIFSTQQQSPPSPPISAISDEEFIITSGDQHHQRRAKTTTSVLASMSPPYNKRQLHFPSSYPPPQIQQPSPETEHQKQIFNEKNNKKHLVDKSISSRPSSGQDFSSYPMIQRANLVSPSAFGSNATMTRRVALITTVQGKRKRMKEEQARSQKPGFYDQLILALESKNNNNLGNRQEEGEQRTTKTVSSPRSPTTKSKTENRQQKKQQLVVAHNNGKDATRIEDGNEFSDMMINQEEIKTKLQKQQKLRKAEEEEAAAAHRSLSPSCEMVYMNPALHQRFGHNDLYKEEIENFKKENEDFFHRATSGGKKKGGKNSYSRRHQEAAEFVKEMLMHQARPGTGGGFYRKK